MTEIEKLKADVKRLETHEFEMMRILDRHAKLINKITKVLDKATGLLAKLTGTP